MTRRYFSGSTLEQAVMAAARHHGLEPEELAYRRIEKRHGFLRTRKAFMISVDPNHPRLEPGVTVAEDEAPAEEPSAAGQPDAAGTPDPRMAAEAEAPAEVSAEAPPPPGPAPESGPPTRPAVDRPEPETAPRQVEPDEEMISAAARATRTLLQFAGIEGEASARSGPERVEVEVEGPDSSVLVVEGGKGLLAIQHLLPRMLRGLTGRTCFVRVDSRGFHRKRKERLEALAQKEADAATRNASARTLPPMAPDERRIVHLALKDMPTVVTESRGSGLHKRVVIRPVEDAGSRDDIEARHGI